MDYILIYDSESKDQWMYVPATNRGLYIYGDLESHYASLTTESCGTSTIFHDVESYIRYAERINNMAIGRLYYNQPDLPYEFW